MEGVVMAVVNISTPAGVTLHVSDEGEGPAVLFVHGIACDGTDWLAQTARFRHSHRVIVVDLRGHGRSSVPDSGYDLRTFADDLVTVLDDRGVGSCIVVGHSLGALISAEFAITHPDRVRAVIAIDPPWGPPSARELFATLAPVVAEPGGLAAVFEASDSPLTPGHFREAHRRGALVTDPAVLRQAWDECFIVPSSLAFDEARLRTRQCPLFVLHSKTPGLIEWEREMSVHPADRAIELPVGHWIHHDLPDLVNEMIQEWTDGLTADAQIA
ncbi:MAG: alpha/beta hydrolase [Hyphomicrobiales bacterium]|nr:MAG: alpha/beta hydrolase [Hyphomicrobiales bacterium]